MTDCSFCDNPAESEKGVIYVRAKIQFNDKIHWTSFPICRNCFDEAR